MVRTYGQIWHPSFVLLFYVFFLSTIWSNGPPSFKNWNGIQQSLTLLLLSLGTAFDSMLIPPNLTLSLFCLRCILWSCHQWQAHTACKACQPSSTLSLLIISSFLYSVFPKYFWCLSVTFFLYSSHHHCSTCHQWQAYAACKTCQHFCPMWSEVLRLYACNPLKKLIKKKSWWT